MNIKPEDDKFIINKENSVNIIKIFEESSLIFFAVPQNYNESEMNNCFINSKDNLYHPIENNYQNIVQNDINNYNNFKYLNIKRKNTYFKITKNNNCGRKKKDSGKIGKHKKTDTDNMRKKAKTVTFKILINIFNNRLKKLKRNDLNFVPVKLLQINQQQASNTTKIYNLDLLNKSIKSILSAPISGRYNNNQNHNRDLINKLYEIYGDNNSENPAIIKFMNMKLKEFFDYVKNLMDNPNFHGKKDDNNEQIEGIIREFILQLDIYFNENNEKEDYNKKLKENIKNFPSVITKMKNCKK